MPAFLTLLAALVVVVAALGVVGVLDAPTPAVAALSGAAASGPPADLAEAQGGDVAEQPAADAAPADAAAHDAAAGNAGAETLAGEQFTAATIGAFGALAQPAADAASPEPVDSAKVPAAPDPGDDQEALPPQSGEGRRVVYSINGQRVWLVESDERVSRTYLVSGRLDRPGPGSYEVYSKSPTATSYTYTEQMQYMIRFAQGERAAIGFHDIPVLDDGTPVQTEAQLGQPLSAGCVRQAEQDAAFLWDWAELGTTVVVVP